MALGAAMLAAVGIGQFRNLFETNTLVRVTTTIEPQPELQTIYDEAYSVFRRVYPALRGVT